MHYKQLIAFLAITCGLALAQGSNQNNFGGATVTLFAGVPSGTCTSSQLAVNTSTGNLYTCNAGSWQASGGGASAWTGVTAGANAATLTETTAGSLVPAQTSATVGLGQITGLTNWLTAAPTIQYPLEATLTPANTGGALTQGTYYFKVTYVGPSVIVPSGETRATLNATNCASNLTCQITLTMPTTCTAGNLPAGVTGCTVWDSNVFNAEKQQAASAACVNITTATCVVGTLAAGASLTTPTSTGVVCPNLQAQTVSDNIIPVVYMIKDDGNCYPEAGLDVQALNVVTDVFFGATKPVWAGGANGTFTWMDRFYISDKTTNPISNALVSINHQSGNTTGTVTASGGTGIDDRAISVRLDNDLTAQPHYEQYLGGYVESFNDNANFTCAPIGFGFPYGESCHAGWRVNAGDFRTANTPALANSIQAIVGIAFAPQTANTTLQSGTGFPSVVGVTGAAVQGGASTNGAANIYAGGFFGAQATAGNTNGLSTAIYAAAPTTRFATANSGLIIGAFSNAADYAIQSQATAKSLFLGPMYLSPSAGPAIVANSFGNLGISGSASVIGSFKTSQLSAAGTVTFGNAVPGATTNTYVVCTHDQLGGTICGAATNNTTSNANITATNFTNVQFQPFATLTTSIPFSVDVYRTVSASTCNGGACTNGKIGTFTMPANEFGAGINQSVTDTGQAGDTTTPQATTINTTGAAQFPLYQTTTNCAQNVASPAPCGSAASGAVVVPTTTTTYTVNTTAVTAASRIMLTPMTFAGNLPSAPTCVTPAVTAEASISAISAGVSFTMALPSTTGQSCWQYWVVD